MNTKSLFLSLVLLFFAGSTLLAQDFKYVGSAKCKMCHNSPKMGRQYAKWKASKHAHAMQTLKGEEALKYAKEHNIGDPSTSPKCIKCHATAASVDKSLLTPGLRISEGVSCESCHGPGSKYKSKAIMMSKEKSLANGLIIPDESVCIKCHNEESPNYKPFDFEKAKAKIAHPTPN